jgi:hypothetical protein
VDQPAQELTRIRVHDPALPGLEDDRPLVLSTGAVLREHVWPQPAATDDTYAFEWCLIAPDVAARRDELHRRPAVLDQLWIPGVAGDHELVAATAADADVAIAEIQAQQIAVGVSIRRLEANEHMFAR